jgi:hypothetical protein
MDERRSIEWLIERFQSSYYTVRRWLDEAGLRRRAQGQKVKRELDLEQVRKMYEQNVMTIQEIAKALNASPNFVAKSVRASGAKMRKSGASKERKPKKQRCVDRFGYVFVLAPESHLADYRGYVREHRLVAETKIGRKLFDWEDVHHIDGDKANNLPENLEVLTRSEHIRRHNNESSTARSFRFRTDSDLRDLTRLLTTTQIAAAFETSPASVQREFERRGIELRLGPRVPPPTYALPEQTRNRQTDDGPDGPES